MSNPDCFDDTCTPTRQLSTGAKVGLAFGLLALALLSLALAIPYGRMRWKEWKVVEMQLPSYSRNPKKRTSLRDGNVMRFFKFMRWRMKEWSLDAKDEEWMDPRLHPRRNTLVMGMGAEPAAGTSQERLSPTNPVELQRPQPSHQTARSPTLPPSPISPPPAYDFAQAATIATNTQART